MFDDLRAAFREAIENFQKELDRDQIPENVDRLLHGMKQEVADAKVQIRELEDQIERAQAHAAVESKEAATCRRREKMARDIGDAETAELAMQFAEKHEERHRVLTRKAEALAAELAFRQREIEEMLDKVKEAQAKRESLAATGGRGKARDSISAADDLFSELDRMADKISGEQSRADAAESFGELDFDDLETTIDVDEPPRREVDFDARLAELKRRMGKE